VTINLVGPADPSPDGIPLSEVQRWNDSGILNYLGESSDVRPHIAACHVYVLPSYHEGMPRTVLEAMAAGRPIITTDVPGCRETVPLTEKGRLQRDRGETVMEGENGYLVRVKDVEALLKAMKRFIDEPELIVRLGRRSREIAEEKYDVHKVNAIMIEAMGLNE
jgi:glycosyltransferase involved in cell wall biosynthesis